MTAEPPPNESRVCVARAERLRWSGAVSGRTADGTPIEVAGVDVGESVRVAVTERGPARLLDVLEASPDRVDARCDQMHDCPGCPLRPLKTARRHRLTDDLHRRALGEVSGAARWSRLPGASDAGGRARAVARALRGPDGQLVLGMTRRGHDPIHLGRCPLQSDTSRALVAQLERELRGASVEPWDPEARRGTLRHVIVHAIGASARVILAIDSAAAPPPVEHLLRDRPDVAVLVDALPRRGAGTMRNPRPLRGRPWIEFTIGGDRYRASPRSWIPQAPETVPAVCAAVLDGLRPRPDHRVVEVGCGIGLLSLPIARRAGAVVGIDIERSAVVDAEFNAATNGVVNARFRTGEATHALRRLLTAGESADGVVMHAMRRPFGEAAMSAVRALAPERIVCLSPFAPALARDLGCLPDHVATSVALCDQTPGTVPDLTVVTLVRR